MPRFPRRIRFPRGLRRADSMLVLLAFVLASLIVKYGENSAEPLRHLPEETPAACVAEPQGELADDEDLPRAGKPVRFLMHNVANYFVAGEQQRSRYTIRPKPLAAREAVADTIAAARPEVVGLIEIGGPLALEDLRERLAARGLHYPHSRVLTRQGEDRALAILSRHPIAADNSRANMPLYGEHRRRMLRGILDVTIRTEDGRLFRIIGAHLKSRVADNPAAASALRGREAHTLAQYLDEVMRRRPKLPILVYGDWNDGPTDASVRVLCQGVSERSALTRLKPGDSRGETWTLYYKREDRYSTFDQIYINKVLSKRLGRKGKEEGGIIDIPAAANASDHRALWCELR